MARNQRGSLRRTPGKLKAAVRRWLDGGESRDDTDDALAAFGLVRDGVEAVIEPFRVYSINWPTLEVFWATWNQWRKVVLKESVVRDGIDWTQIESALNLSGIKRSEWPMIFEGLRKMETTALEYLNRD